MVHFIVARNPDGDSSLPYLIQLPLEGGVVLKARDRWPTTSRVYCHPHEGPLPDDAEILETVAVVTCARRGRGMVDLVLDRPRESRSQLLFTETKGRRAIFWQTQKVAKLGNPGGRVPMRRTAVGSLTITVDTRERYGYRFAGREVTVERAALPAGDYGVRSGEGLTAVVERKSIEDLAGSLAEGKLAFQLGRLMEQRRGAIVVEGSYPALFEVPRVPQGWLPDILARLQLRYPSVPIVFAHSRKFAEEWVYRYLAAAVAEDTDG